MRAHGEGSVYQRDGRLVAQLALGYADGKRKRKTIYQHQGESDRDFRARVRRVQKDLDDGLPVQGDERETVGAYLERWLGAVGPSLRPKTLRTYQDHVKLHLKPGLGSVRLTKLTPDQVQRFLNSRTDLSPRSVRHLRATLRAALHKAQQWGMVPRNVATLTTPPRLPRREIRVLTPDEARALLAAAEGNRLRALYHVAFLGLRQGEILALRWQSIDWTNGSLRVDKSLQRVSGKLMLVDPKTERSARTVMVPPAILEALRVHQREQQKERLALRGRVAYIDHQLVFCTRIGTPLDARNVIRDFHALTRKAGLPRIRFHDLRHSTATLLLAAGVPINMVAEILGHSDTTMVAKTYGHVLDQMRREAADKMEVMLGG